MYCFRNTHAQIDVFERINGATNLGTCSTHAHTHTQVRQEPRAKRISLYNIIIRFSPVRVQKGGRTGLLSLPLRVGKRVCAVRSAVFDGTEFGNNFCVEVYARD